MKTKPFPPPIISSPLDQPTESTPRAAPQGTGMQYRRQLSSLHNKANGELYQCQSSPAGPELCCDAGPGPAPQREVANRSPRTATANIPPLPPGEAAASSLLSCSCGGQSRGKGQTLGHRSAAATLLPCDPRHRDAAPPTWKRVGHLPSPSCLLLEAFSLLLFHTQFPHSHYIADCAITYITTCFFPASRRAAQLTATART